MKQKDKQKATWALISAGSAMLAGAIMDRALSRSFKSYYSERSPADPTSRDFSWMRAMAWTAGTAALVGMTQRAALRGAALGWKKKTGKLPPRG